MSSTSCGALSTWFARHCVVIGIAAIFAGMACHGASRACATLEHATLQRVNSSQWPAYTPWRGSGGASPRVATMYLAPLEPDPPSLSEIERMLRPIQPMMTMSCES